MRHPPDKSILRDPDLRDVEVVYAVLCGIRVGYQVREPFVCKGFDDLA